MKRHVFLGAASLSLAAGFASAGGLQPIEAARLDLGSVSGVVYYSEAADGFHVVATLVEGQAQPVRVQAVLAPDESLVISTPGPVDSPATAVVIARDLDVLIVEPAAALTQ